MLNDARVASLGFFKDNVCTTRINKEKKIKIKFQVLLKFTHILPDYKMWTDAQSEWSPKYTEQDAEQTEQAEQQPKYAKQDAD